jgi:hypothetical protein
MKLPTMAHEQDDELRRLLQQVLSPAEAQSLVLPPPTHAPACGPAESTPLTGNLAKPPSQAVPSREPEPTRRGLATHFASGSSMRNRDSQYVKVSSHGQVGYLPKANLEAAKQVDSGLIILDE